MAFNSNTTYGTTVYTTGTFFDNAKIVANDGSSLSSNTLATQSGLTIDLGGYERILGRYNICLLYTSPSPRDKRQSRMPSSA